jgi:hypothetical protein
MLHLPQVFFVILLMLSISLAMYYEAPFIVNTAEFLMKKLNFLEVMF